MTLSVCLITRNEEKSLAQALRSVRGLADEVIVADTGSTDRTKSIATSEGALVHDHTWVDDFAAARNFALDQATSDWILWLNPDEEVIPASHALIRECLARAEAFAYGIIVQEIIQPDRPDLITDRPQGRLFRRHPNVRYLGRLHPDFQTPLDEIARHQDQQVLLSAATIRHHAYLSQLSEAKLRWAAQLMELELRDRPGNLHYLIEFGRTLLQLNDPKGHNVLAEAVERLLPLHDQPTAPVATVQRLLEYVLTIEPSKKRGRLSVDEARDLARRWFPTSPPLLWRLAESAFQANDFLNAAGYLEQLVLCGQTGLYDRCEVFDPTIIGDPARMNLGVCYIRIKELNRAEAIFRELLSNPAYQTQAVQNLSLIQDMRLQSVQKSDDFWATMEKE